MSQTPTELFAEMLAKQPGANGTGNGHGGGVTAVTTASTARRLFNRMLVGAPIPLPDSDVAVRYNLDRVMGWDAHGPDVLDPLFREGRDLQKQIQTRNLAFAEQWADYTARHLGTTHTTATQLQQVADILAAPITGADKLANLRRYLGAATFDAPTAAETAAYEAAQAAHLADLDLLTTRLLGLQRRRDLATIADCVVAVGVLETHPDGVALTWPADLDTPRPDPQHPDTWDAVSDLDLAWVARGAGFTQAREQVDGFLSGRASAPTGMRP